MPYTVERKDGEAFFLSDAVLHLREVFPYAHAWFDDNPVKNHQSGKSKKYSAQTFRIKVFLDFYDPKGNFPQDKVQQATDTLRSLGYEMTEIREEGNKR